MNTRKKTLTLTLHPAVDWTVTLPKLVPGEVNRAQHSQISAGGKGIGVAAVLAALHFPVRACGWLGNENASLFESDFEKRGIEDGMIRIPGETRTNIKIADLLAAASTDINLPGPILSESDQNGAESRLIEGLKSDLPRTNWLQIGGSLPPGTTPAFYNDVISCAQRHQVPVALDTGGATLKSVLHLCYEKTKPFPALIKPNRAELEEWAGTALASDKTLVAAAQRLVHQGVPYVIVSCGASGVFIVTQNGAWYAEPPKVQVATTVGAGDTLLGGTLAGLLSGRDLPAAVSFGMACAAIRVTQVQAQFPPRAVIEEMASRIVIQPVATD